MKHVISVQFLVCQLDYFVLQDIKINRTKFLRKYMRVRGDWTSKKLYLEVFREENQYLMQTAFLD